MGNSYLTFNYTATKCCGEVGHIVHQSEKGLKSGRGREDKLGQAWSQKWAVSQWPHLWTKAHTCHPSWCVSLSLTHKQYITYCIHTHTPPHMLAYTSVDNERHTQRQIQVQKDACSWTHIDADASLWTPAGGPCCTFLNSHDTSSQPLGISSHVPASSTSSTHSPPAPFLLSFLPVNETDVR